uniref:Uncharacterized protein n=1 Tax=Fagus sylvatica TaxID=28930 RepID=A0A2N9IV79_FAGSY
MEEVAISENNHGGARLPTFNRRKIQSEVRVPGGRRGREEQRSHGRIEGRQHSPSKEPSFLGEARKRRRIEELEEELRLLKEEDKEKGDQHQRRRSKSHSGSCGSPNHVPSHKECSRKSKHRFVAPNLAVYDGKGDPVGHLSRYQQSMALHTSNDALMCRIFPSSLGEVGLRWFDCLDHESIRSWQEMFESFTARFITNTRKPKEIDALLALKMKAEETLKSYSARYWEVYNDIDACDEDIVVKTFRFGLHQDIKLRRSLTKRPPISMADLMTRLEEHIRVEDNSKSSTRTVEAASPVDKKAAQPEQSQTKRSRRSMDQPRARTCMALVKNGHLRQYIDETKSSHQNIEAPKATIKDSTPLGIIEVIHYGTTSHDQREVMRRAAHLREVFQIGDSAQMAPIPLKKESAEQIVFTNQDLEGVQLPHSDALVVTLRIGEFDVKRVLIDPGSSVKIMYESLFKGLGLEKKDLNLVEGPLSGFFGETVVPSGKVTINVRAGTVSSPTEFFVLNAFSPYNAILGRPWLHRMGAVPSTLHQRLRFPTPQRVMEILGDQLATKQCLVAAIRHKSQLPQEPREGLDGRAQVTVIDPPQRIPRRLCMDSVRGTRSKFRICLPQTERFARVQTSSPESKKGSTITCQGRARRSRTALEDWSDSGSFVPTVAVQHRRCKEEKWKVEGLCKFYRSEQSLPKRPFPTPEDRSVGGLYGRPQKNELLGCFPRVPPDCPEKRRPRKDRVHHTPRNILLQVYIDDMVVKSVKSTDHVGDLRKVFRILRRHNLKLNASKCAFGGLQPPRNVREVQRLTGMAVALNRFISKLAERCRPFFDLIKKGKNFAWSEESDQAFERLKRYLSTPPLLSSPKEGEPLYIYLAASDKAVCAAIIRDDSGEQRPVYYTSKTMNGAETRYLPLKKLALALFITAKKLPHYFQAHTMIVLTSLPLKALFRSLDFNSRISKWGAHLGAYDVRYKPRTSIKGQPEGELLEQAVRLGYGASNNEAEYEALLHGLRAAKRLGADPLTIHSDSQLIVNQVTGEYMAKDERMVAYRDLAKNLLKGFHKFNVERVGREHNGHADSLAGLASSVAPDFRRTITVEVQDSPSMMKSSQAIICQIEMGPNWMDPIVDYLTKDILPADRKEAAKGLDLVGPLPRATGNRQWLIVATDYFTKWVEAEPLARITDSESRKFVWKNIITHFGIPKCLISDNGTQFDNGPFKKYCSEFGIRNHFFSPAYPQGNGQAESSNKTILNGIKKRLEKAKGRWVEELPTILWTFRTTPRSLTRKTPFSLTYGVEAVIPLEGTWYYEKCWEAERTPLKANWGQIRKDPIRSFQRPEWEHSTSREWTANLSKDLGI